MSDFDHLEPVRHHGDFWSQVPVVLFTLAAVVALFVVNQHTQVTPEPAVEAPAAASDVKLAPVGCPDCGEIIAVRPVAADPAHRSDQTGTPEGGVLLDVRMSDGSIRTIRQFSTGFDVGDHVQVNGNALVARS